MFRLFLLMMAIMGLFGCSNSFIKQPGNCFEVSHTQSSNHGLTCITSIQI